MWMLTIWDRKNWNQWLTLNWPCERYSLILILLYMAVTDRALRGPMTATRQVSKHIPRSVESVEIGPMTDEFIYMHQFRTSP